MTQASEFSLNIMVALTQKLTALVVQETDLLRKMKISEIAHLQGDKNEIAGLLEKQQNHLRDDLALRASLSADDKLILKRAAVSFDEAIADYQKELYKARTINELVIAKMLEAVKDHVTRNRSYTANGTKIANGMELAKNTPAIRFNSQA